MLRVVQFLRCLAIGLTSFVLLTPAALAALQNPYVEEPNVPMYFGDSIEIDGHFGLENYAVDYVNGFLRIQYTTTHHNCCWANYPPEILITAGDPRKGYGAGNIYWLGLISPNMNVWHAPTDWYRVVITFDNNGFTGQAFASNGALWTEVRTNTGAAVGTAWAAVFNNFPGCVDLSDCAYSMAFRPVPIRAGRWPLEPVEFSQVTQDFAQFNDYATGKYHSGMDIAGDLGAAVYPIRIGHVVFIQENGGRVKAFPACDSARNPGSNCADHGFGNTVIVRHAASDGTPYFSQYSHLASINEALKTSCGTRDPITRRRDCSGSPVAVDLGTQLGTLGRSGWGQDEFPGYGTHLHLEVKSLGVLGSAGHDEGSFGYSFQHPEALGYSDPAHAIHSAEQILQSQLVSPHSSTALLMGPEGNGGSPGYPMIDTTGTYVDKKLVATHIAPGTADCPDGWYKIERIRFTEFPRCSRDQETNRQCFPPTFKPSAPIPDAWACRSAFDLGPSVSPRPK